MAVQTPGSITSEALLRLTDLHFNEKEAKLKAERATAIKSVEGRQMIPGVMAQLAELEQKKAQQKAKIAKQAEDQGVSQKSLLPPMTDVTGQTRGQVDTKAIGELAGQLLHKGGPQPAGQGAAMQGMGGSAIHAAAQAGLNMARPGVGQGINPNAPSPTGGIPAQTSPAGQENIFRQLGRVGLNMLGGRVGGVALGSEFLPGPPTAEEIAQSNAATARTLAPGMSVLERRRRDPNPAISGPAQQMYDKRMTEIEQINPGVAAESRRQGFDLYLAQEEEIRIRQEDPKYKVQRERAEAAWGIEQKVIEGGVGSLTPGEREFYEGKKPGVNATVNILAPTGAEKSRMQGLLEQGRTAIQHLDSIDSVMSGADWAFTAEGKADVGWLRLQKQSPLVFGALKPEEDERIAKFTRVENAISAFTVPAMHEMFGAALTPGEIERAEPLFPSMSKDLITNQTDLEQLREDYALGLFRRELVLEKNQAIDPRFSMSLGHTKQAAIDAVMERTDEHIAAGLDPHVAGQRTEFEFRSRYGLDVNHLLGVIQPGSQSRE